MLWALLNLLQKEKSKFIKHSSESASTIDLEIYFMCSISTQSWKWG